MARPLKDQHERRSEQLPPIRLTLAERSFVEEQAARAGVASVSDYCRAAILGKPLQPRTETTADPALVVALNRAGVNLNQVARHLNSGRGLPPDFRAVVAEFHRVLSRVLPDGA